MILNVCRYKGAERGDVGDAILALLAHPHSRDAGREGRFFLFFKKSIANSLQNCFAQ
jgi:hypothetical protein